MSSKQRVVSSMQQVVSRIKNQSFQPSPATRKKFYVLRADGVLQNVICKTQNGITLLSQRLSEPVATRQTNEQFNAFYALRADGMQDKKCKTQSTRYNYYPQSSSRLDEYKEVTAACLDAVQGSNESRSELYKTVLRASNGINDAAMRQEVRQSKELCSLAGLTGRRV